MRIIIILIIFRPLPYFLNMTSHVNNIMGKLILYLAEAFKMLSTYSYIRYKH